MSELDCAICHELLLQPVTTVCGHTFCRNCLVRALDYREECPACRAHVAPNFNVNVLLAAIVESRFPAELARRQQEQAPQPAAVASPAEPALSAGLVPVLISRDKRTALLPNVDIALDASLVDIPTDE